MPKYYALPCPHCGSKTLTHFGYGLICRTCDGLTSFAAYNRMGGKAYKSYEREQRIFGDKAQQVYENCKKSEESKRNA